MKIYIRSASIAEMDLFHKVDLAKTSNDINVLKQLANDEEETVRMSVAIHTEYPELLAQLANDEDALVRTIVAEYTDDLQLMKQLVNDENKAVRAALTRNKYVTDASILTQLANDESEWVRERFAKNKGHIKPASKSSASWPTEDELYDAAEDDYAFEDMWHDYLREPETKVDNEFQIFPEPSVQGNMGAMFIFDEAEPRRFNPIRIDWQEWQDAELDMAASSSSAKEFEKKYRKYIKSLIDNADPYEERNF